MRIRLPKIRRYRVYLYILSILLILIAVDLILVHIGHHITIGYDTTRITAPLKPDGMPDYVKALDDEYGAGVTAENNAAPLLLTAIGPNALSSESADAIYSRLGMQRLPSRGDYFTPFAKYSSRDTAATHRDHLDPDAQERLARQHLWLRTDSPRLAAWLDSQSHVLTLFHEGVRRTRLYIPLTTPKRRAGSAEYLEFPPTERLFAMADAALARAMFRAGESDFDAAQSSLLDVHRLARLIAQGPTAGEFWVGNWVEEEAFKTERALAADVRLTPAGARNLLAAIDGLPSFPELARKLDTWPRYSTLDGLVAAAGQRPSVVIDQRNDTLLASAWGRLIIDYVPTSFNAALRRANGLSDALVDACRAPTFSQRIAKVKAIDQLASELSSNRPGHGYFDPAECILGTYRIDWTFLPITGDERAMNFDLTRLSLALAAYHGDHQTYPNTLMGLVPEYLPMIPLDRFIDQALRYQPTHGGYLMYSVGVNMTDDGGHNPEHKNAANPRADDLVVLVGEFPTTRPK